MVQSNLVSEQQLQHQLRQRFAHATELHQRGDLKRAYDIYQELLKVGGANPVIDARLAKLFAQQGKVPLGLAHYRKAIAKMPDERSLREEASDLALRSGDTRFALECLSTILEKHPNDIRVREKYIGALLSDGQDEKARSAVKQALNSQKDNPTLINFKGLLLCRAGDIDKGYQLFERAIKIAPGHLGVLKNLVIYEQGRDSASLRQLMPQLERQLRASKTPSEQLAMMAHTLFVYYERRDPDKAFPFLILCNDIKRQAFPYQHKDSYALFERIRSSFTPSFIEFCRSRFERLELENEESDLCKAAPIFILGMPRTGTTLVEQILANHSKVNALGELKHLSRSFELNGAKIFDLSLDASQRFESLMQVAKGYLSEIGHQSGNLHFTDKMPYNFMFVGMIAVLLPNAKIIHCTRDPVETCFSIYKHQFQGNHGYTNRLDEVAQYYNLYQSLMAHWQDCVGDRIYDIPYEALVNHPEDQIKALLAHCDLEEEARCYQFHKARRTVKTASAAQVREGIYRDALTAAKPFYRYLTPMIEALASGEGGLSASEQKA